VSDKAYKAFERRVAKRLGGRRIPSTGEKHGIDVDCGWLVVQCKNGYRMPGYLRGWLRGIREQAAQRVYEGQQESWHKLGGSWSAIDTRVELSSIGAVVWRSGGQTMDDDDALVVMSLKDFGDLYAS
jgi:hypothetical protein|tara:strand:- start:4924 stop:5304 length:381 start_codon:yes stop_codon:yes gene_type:complete